MWIRDDRKRNKRPPNERDFRLLRKVLWMQTEESSRLKKKFNVKRLFLPKLMVYSKIQATKEWLLRAEDFHIVKDFPRKLPFLLALKLTQIEK